LIEVARNLPYDEVGIVNGLPAGKIPREQSFIRNGFTFELTASVQSVDDPFDGVIGSSTKNDEAPSDYKRLQYDIVCPACPAGVFPDQRVVTTIAPSNLEMAAGGGALLVKVFNAVGDPVAGAHVRIINSSLASLIDIRETADNVGAFLLLDAPPGLFSYAISATKAGYSLDQTIASSTANLNPLKPLASVSAGEITQLSFTIDQLASLNLRTINSACGAVSISDIKMRGEKLVGQLPDIFKIDRVLSTSGGTLSLTDLEWDTYKFWLDSASPYSVTGTIPASPLVVSPGSAQDMSLIIRSRQDRGLLVTVKDASTGLPLDGAEVTVGDSTEVTSQGYFSQSDWSVGPGQTQYENISMFSETDGNIDFGTVGEIKLRSSLGQYLPSGYIVSSVFDTGGTTTDYAAIDWSPSDQPVSAGLDSVRLQIASGNEAATSTWNFIGPDGTSNSYFTVPNTSVGSYHDGNQFLRYKILLGTADSSATPNISSISLTFSSACTPPGQAYFDGLSGDTQIISVTRPGYGPYSSTLNTVNYWQSATVLLSPQ